MLQRPSSFAIDAKWCFYRARLLREVLDTCRLDDDTMRKIADAASYESKRGGNLVAKETTP